MNTIYIKPDLSKLNQKIILDLFNVDFEAGKIFWKKVRPCLAEKLRKRNFEAGSMQKCGSPKHRRIQKYYCYVYIQGVGYCARSKIIFCAYHGRLPDGPIDHANGDSTDDRICNLREATVAQNVWNSQKPKKLNGLPVGVSRNVKGGKYYAGMRHKGEYIYLGTYDTPEQAGKVYSDKKKELCGMFAPRGLIEGKV